MMQHPCCMTKSGGFIFLKLSVRHSIVNFHIIQNETTEISMPASSVGIDQNETTEKGYNTLLESVLPAC